MDIICKCGHHADEHRGPFGCQVKRDNLGNFCECEMHRDDVAIIFALEQQARLDANRAQVEALIAERDALQKMFDNERDNYAELNEKLTSSQIENCELRRERDQLRDALFPFAAQCPFEIDKATVPAAGIQAAPQQVVVNMSVGWLRIVLARTALGIKGHLDDRKF